MAKSVLDHASTTMLSVLPAVWQAQTAIGAMFHRLNRDRLLARERLDPG
jgi:hypothetical protein